MQAVDNTQDSGEPLQVAVAEDADDFGLGSELELDDDVAKASAEAQAAAFGPNAEAPTDFDYRLFDPKKRVEVSRAHMQGLLNQLNEEKAAIERRIGAAEAECNQKIQQAELRLAAAVEAAEIEKKQAMGDFLKAKEDAEEDLEQITVCREGTEAFVQRLNKSGK